MSSPIVSVALCTYNSGPYLKPLLESLLAQTWRPLEIVCSDDHSSDGTWEILEHYQSMHPYIFRIYRNEKNLGYIKNFERSLFLSKGEFIALADHDDIWL